MANIENIIMRLRSDSAPGQDVNLGILPSVMHTMREAADALYHLRGLLAEAELYCPRDPAQNLIGDRIAAVLHNTD